MLPKIAAITMVFNEGTLLPVWARHYARQVGADHCYVVDHGSTDTIVLPPGMNTIRIPRSAHDDARRAAFIADLAKTLLRYYDWFLYSDVDELILADPRRHQDLPSFCGNSADLQGTITAVGLDVQQVPVEELALDPTRSVGMQRGWARFTSAMCKPVLTRQPLAWSPGFHSSEHPITFGGLYLFHLHWADEAIGLARLRKTRSMAWADDAFGAHQRVSDATWQATFSGMANLPRNKNMSLDLNAFPTRDWLSRTEESSRRMADRPFRVDLSINAPELWPIPWHFRERL